MTEMPFCSHNGSAPPADPAPAVLPLFQLQDFTVTAGPHRLLDGISLSIAAGGVYGLLGPSGAGKSTLLKSLNRLAVLTAGLRFSGRIFFHGQPLYPAPAQRSLSGDAPDAAIIRDDDALRTRIGMLFQQPVIFPASIQENVLFGLKRLGLLPRRELPRAAEQALREAALWDEVKDRLRAPARQLSTGQQQRLCLARALACRPEVLLMDEPTSALDPRATAAIEELILTLGQRLSIVLVTHHFPQAERLCGRAALITGGRLQAEGPVAGVIDEATRVP